jgi:hypothetical protein
MERIKTEWAPVLGKGKFCSESIAKKTGGSADRVREFSEEKNQCINFSKRVDMPVR